MGLGQTMLTAAFLVLVTVAAMNANKMIVDRDINYYEQEAYREAGILAKSLLTEIQTKKFDENDSTDVLTTYQNTSSFTSSASIGPDPIWSSFWGFYYISGYEENNVPLPDSLTASLTVYRSVSNAANRYDDIDDYDGYIRYAGSGNLTGFYLNVDVYYVNSSDLSTPTTSRTYFKRVDVTVTNSIYLQPRDVDGDGDEDDIELKFSTVIAY